MDFPLSAAFSGGVSSRFVIPIYLYHACRNNARGTGAAPYCVPLVHRSARIFHWPFSCRTHFFYRTLFLYRSSFLLRPPFLRGEFSFGFPWGMWKRGLGLWIRELLSSEAEQGFRRGIAGLWEEWGVFCGKKEKYAENILLFCTFYWYQ